MLKTLVIRPWPIALIGGIALIAIAAIVVLGSIVPPCDPPTASIIIDQPVSSGQTAPLTADIRGAYQHIEWHAERGSIANPDSPATNYTAPATGESDTITLRIFYKADCPAAEVIQRISIVIPPLQPADTLTPTPTNTSTPSATMTPSPSDTPTASATQTSSDTPTSAPTSPPPTFTVPAPSLVLLEPQNATCVGLGQNVVFSWNYIRALNNIEGPGGEYFALDLWTTGTPKQSVAWIKQPQYIIDVGNPIPVFLHFVDCQVESGCFWSVSVIRANRFPGQDPFDGDHTVLTSSLNRIFCTRGNLPPTATPTDRPLGATPTDTLAPP